MLAGVSRQTARSSGYVSRPATGEGPFFQYRPWKCLFIGTSVYCARMPSDCKMRAYRQVLARRRN